MLILTAVVLGPLVTRLPLADYFSDSETFTYVPRNLSLIFLQWELPGVFADNPFGGAINGSLWTLFHEVVCYGGVLLAGMLGAFHSRARMTACLLIFSAVYIAFNYTGLQDFASRRLDRLLFLGLPFAIGTSFYVWRAIIPLHAFLATGLIAVAALARDSLLYEPLFMLSLSYTVFVLAYLPKGRILNYNRLGDYSYGMYVYAFPVQQLVMYLYGPLSPAGNMLLSFPLALACAVLSWTYVEKPALALARKPREPAPQERILAGEPVGPPSITAGQS